MQWKHKTKLNIIKQIRERSLFTCIPETDTIQDILYNLYPAIFTSKNCAKYFLTIIGDNILKKNQHLLSLGKLFGRFIFVYNILNKKCFC